jgi:RNA polymerase sigma factor (sigma-70 family)
MTAAMEPTTHAARKPAATFATTHWTHVLSARGDSPEARQALSELCNAYYAPVFAFVRHNSRDEEAARDLTQEFFTRLLARQGLDTVERDRGRFRSFLLGAVKHFLSDMRDHAAAQKRGAGLTPLPITPETDTSPGLQLPDAARSPDLEFDRKWALTLLDRALATLAREHADAGKASQFEALKPWLTGDSDQLSQAQAARQLELNEGAVKVAIHRLRRRFRELVNAEIAHTVPDTSSVQQELQHLFEALGR